MSSSQQSKLTKLATATIAIVGGIAYPVTKKIVAPPSLTSLDLSQDISQLSRLPSGSLPERLPASLPSGPASSARAMPTKVDHVPDQSDGHSPVQRPQPLVQQRTQRPHTPPKAQKQGPEITKNQTCRVVLKGTNKNYQIIACDNNPKPAKSLLNWFFYDVSNRTLEKIDGITTTNDTKGRLIKDTDDSWKTREWQGYRGTSDGKGNTNKELAGSPFVIDYGTRKPFKFPFFIYLATGTYCAPKKYYGYWDDGVSFVDECSSFDLNLGNPNRELTERLWARNIQNTFGFGKEKMQCFITDKQSDEDYKWKITGNCDSPSKK